MNYFTISSLLIFITSVVIGLVIFIKGKNRSLSRVWLLFCLAVAIWGIGGYNISICSSKVKAIHWWRISTCGIILIPVFYYHFVNILIESKNKNFLRFVYILTSLFIGICFLKEDFIGELRFVFDQFYWPYWWGRKSVLFLFFFLFYYGFLLLFTFYKLTYLYFSSSGFKRNQFKYFIIGSLVGWIGGESNFLPTFGLNFYPVFNIFIAIYTGIFAYAIVKYRLMDITVAITRTSIFIAVYSLVLGIPFFLAFGWQESLQRVIGDKWWLAPLITSTVLATAGPFIYLYIQRRAENALFQEQKRYQSTLRQASIGMGRIKDLNRLVNLIVHIVTRTVRLEHSIIYLYDKNSGDFSYAASRSRQVRFHPQQVINGKSFLVKYLSQWHNPILYDEIKQRTQDYGDRTLAHLEQELHDLEASLVIPSFIEDKLQSLIVLGEKVSRKPFTNDDLDVFTILANQSALAIENALFYDDMKQTHEQLFKAEKMATIGTMADGLSHQINNRLHALGFIAGDVLDTISLKRDLPMSEELREVFVDVEHALTRIQDNVTKGGEIVRGLLKYTRKGEEGFTSVELDKLVDAAIEMTQFKIKAGAMTIIREYGNEIPKIKGNFTQLQEVFFNLIDNAFDAMAQRRAELQEEGFKSIIKVNAKYEGGKFIDITVTDNGIGIKDDDKNKLFTPFFTTKVSSKKGTGLGLYVIRKLIEENHGGKVYYVSKYGEGTVAHIKLEAIT